MSEPKLCSCCGKVHSAESWSRLQLVGVQDFGDGLILELRNCQCRSTLAVELQKSEES